jgi:hypothetical protein
MSYSKTITTLLACIAIVTGPSGCTKSNEKKLSASTRGESGINCQLEIKDNGGENVNYKMLIKFNNVNNYKEQLNNKLHEEAKRKFAVYENLKRYCDESKIKSICDSLDLVMAEVKTTAIDVSYEVRFYNDKSSELSNISYSIPYEMSQNDFIKSDRIEFENRIKMSRATFDDISYITVRSNL